MATLKDRSDQYPGQPEQAWMNRKNITVSEKGQSYGVTFTRACMSAVFAIDGGIIKDTNSVKCDKLVLLCLDDQSFYELFVELKGADIKHAIEQIEQTLKMPLFQDKAVKTRQARIIGRHIPKNTGSSITEIAKKNFIKKYQCRLEFKTGPAKETLTL